MSNYTKEQLKYINYNGSKNTKLLACAGSGKTRCIVARMDKLLKKKIYDVGSIMMLTFSRFTKDDFIKKIKSYNASYLNDSCVRTIDSFAKSLIDKDNNIDVSLLSFKFMKYLEQDVKILKANDRLTRLKIVFIDEAQDLNEIQYNIFVLLKTKLNVNINLIGDPNQNIYQFRKSSDKYLNQFDGKVFRLTRNFRSCLSIVNFSKYLRPSNETDIVCTKGDNKCKPIIMFYKNDTNLETELVSLLTSAKKNGCNLSDFAILSPTRGRMRGKGKSHGLCLISNILNKNKIKFKQFYEEGTEDVVAGGINYAPQKDHVNILTYMGSKGLEWKYVILVDADMCLINKRIFNNEKHNNDRYLLYVACSRAIENMFIFSKYNFVKSNIEFKLNPWFDIVPKKLYHLDKDYKSQFKFPDIKFIDMSEKERRITKRIDRFDEYTLDELAELINYDKIEENKVLYEKFYKKEFYKQSSIFLGKYIERLFNVLNNIKHNIPHKSIPDIENIVNSTYVVYNVPINVTEWFYANRNKLTWNKFNSNNSIEINIKNYINKHFDKSKELHKHTIINDGYFKWFILSKKEWMKKMYEKYINCRNKKKIRKYLFYMVVISHSFETQHYFHIHTKGKKFEWILETYKDMFTELEDFVKDTKYEFVDNNIPISKYDLAGEIDVIDKDGSIWEIKCVNTITLKHFLQVLIYNIMYDDESKFKIAKSSDINLNFLNLLQGEILRYKIELNREVIERIIKIFQDSDN
jgi:hypothetical protein